MAQKIDVAYLEDSSVHLLSKNCVKELMGLAFFSPLLQYKNVSLKVTNFCILEERVGFELKDDRIP